MTLKDTDHNMVASSNTTSVDSRQSETFNANTWTSWSNVTFLNHESTQEHFFYDETSQTQYRVTLIVGNDYNNNFLSIEKLN